MWANDEINLEIAAALYRWLEKEDNLEKMTAKGQASLNDSKDWGGMD